MSAFDPKRTFGQRRQGANNPRPFTANCFGIRKDDAIGERFKRFAFVIREEYHGPGFTGSGGLPALGAQGRCSNLTVAFERELPRSK
jgi:hypothetical protein